MTSRAEYEAFRSKPWSERTEAFGAMSAETKADIVRTHITYWLDGHRSALTPAQIAILEETIAFIRPELYQREAQEQEWLVAAKQLELRTAELLTREQMREALTMHW